VNHPSFRPFPRVTHAVFRRRVNRFLIECEQDGSVLTAYLPNPGRLWELLLPESIVYLTDNRNVPGRSTRHTAVAVERDGRPVMLHTHYANNVVKHLIDTDSLPGLPGARILRSEVSSGGSRFDFLLRFQDEPFYLEVKACTLFQHGIALFPDAVTARGTRHLRHLADLSRNGGRGGIVFLVNTPDARYFIPDYHTDLTFARTLLAVKKDILVSAVGIEWTEDLTLGPAVTDVAIPWPVIESEVHDGGCYILILHLPRDETIIVGGLGTLTFTRGYYCYAGSAVRHLSRRIERHLRKRKKFFWHIDYLRDRADSCIALPLRTRHTSEHDLARGIGKIGGRPVPAFGSSDCTCRSHLFAMRGNPIHDRRFISLMLDFRIAAFRGEVHRFTAQSS